jgi:hypothetical protein
MSTNYNSFEDVKSVVSSLVLLERNLSALQKELEGVNLVVKHLLQDKLCSHTSTTKWKDYSDYHRAASCETCNDCKKDLK